MRTASAASSTSSASSSRPTPPTSKPMAHPLEGQVQRLRDDVVTSGNERERNQRNAPQVEAGLYLVPRVIE